MVYLSKKQIFEKHKKVILHYMRYEEEIRLKKITPTGAMCKIATEINISVDGVRYILNKEGVYINKDNFMHLEHLPWAVKAKERWNIINQL